MIVIFYVLLNLLKFFFLKDFFFSLSTKITIVLGVIEAAEESVKATARCFCFVCKSSAMRRCSQIESTAAAVDGTTLGAVPPATCPGNETSRAKKAVGKNKEAEQQ